MKPVAASKTATGQKAGQKRVPFEILIALLGLPIAKPFRCRSLAIEGVLDDVTYPLCPFRHSDDISE